MKKFRTLAYIFTFLAYLPVFTYILGTLQFYLQLGPTSLDAIIYGPVFVEIWLNFIFIPLAAILCLATFFVGRKQHLPPKQQIIYVLLFLSLILPILLSFILFNDRG